MKCSHCSAELPASANHCFHCGQPVQTTDRSVSPERQHATFSYLPANTPPWPTSVPVFAHAQKPVDAQPVAGKEQQEEKPKRSLSTVLGMIALALLIPLIGAGITLGTLFARGQVGEHPAQVAAATNPNAVKANPTSTAAASGNQLPTPTSSKKISDSDLNILLQYPDNWDSEQVNKSTTDTSLEIHPHQQLGISFFVIHLTESVSSHYQSADDVNQLQLQALVQQGGVNDVQQLQSSEAQPTIAGTKWSTQEALLTTTNQATYHFTVISTQRNKSYYTLMFLIPDVYYDEAMSKYIQPIIKSVQFLK